MDQPILDQPLLFISDIHLGGFSEKKNAQIESELIQLLNYCQRNNTHIAILGDLFDYWMEYPNHHPDLGNKLLNRFEQFNDALGPTLYITGNHDNWTRDYLLNRGFYLEHEQYTFSRSDGSRIMTLHGDGLRDSSFYLNRPLLHRLIRNKYFIELYQSIFSSQVGITIMKYFSRFTRTIDSTDDAEPLNRWAKNYLENSDIDIIICGHDHIPRRKQFPFGTYINLGTFYEHRTMALYNNDTISLVCWEPGTQSLNQFDTN